MIPQGPFQLWSSKRLMISMCHGVISGRESSEVVSPSLLLGTLRSWPKATQAGFSPRKHKWEIELPTSDSTWNHRTMELEEALKATKSNPLLNARIQSRSDKRVVQLSLECLWCGLQSSKPLDAAKRPVKSHSKEDFSSTFC